MPLPHISDWLQSHAPFMAMVAPAPKLSAMRIIEAVIIAGLSGAFTVSVLTIRLDERLQAFKQQQEIIVTQLRRDNDDLRRMMDKMTDQLMDHLTRTGGKLPS